MHILFETYALEFMCRQLLHSVSKFLFLFIGKTRVLFANKTNFRVKPLHFRLEIRHQLPPLLIGSYFTKDMHSREGLYPTKDLS